MFKKMLGHMAGAIVIGLFLGLVIAGTRWAPTGYKWGFNSFYNPLEGKKCMFKKAVYTAYWEKNPHGISEQEQQI